MFTPTTPTEREYHAIVTDSVRTARERIAAALAYDPAGRPGAARVTVSARTVRIRRFGNNILYRPARQNGKAWQAGEIIDARFSF